jgi:hypothetical protein
MIALESQGVGKKTTEIAIRVASGAKEFGATAIETGKSVGREAIEQGSKAWGRVKEGPVGMWVREKRANRLATKMDRQQQRVDELAGQIKDAGNDFATVAKLGEEQMMRVGKINNYAEKRRALADKLGNHYTKKLEKPTEDRKGIEDGMKDATSRRDALVAKNEKYKTVFTRFQERQASLLGSRAYERSGEMANIAKSLSVMADQMKGLEEDIATEDRVIETAKNDISKWDAKHSGTKQQIQRWSDTSLDGRHGTKATRVQDVIAQKKLAPEIAKRAPEVPAKKEKEAANDNGPEILPTEKAKIPERTADGEALQAFLQEVLREDLREALQKIVDKYAYKDVMNGESAKGGTVQFIELWKQIAEAGRPKVEGFSPAEISKLKEHSGKVSLVEFGVLISEKTSLPIEEVKKGVEKIAERWNMTLEKQNRQAA